MKMEKAERAKELLSLSKSLKSWIPRYIETINKYSCEKYNMGVNIDNQHTVFSAKISIDAYVGYHRNSSCSTFHVGGSDKDKEDLFRRAVMHHLAELIQTMGDLARQDALKMKAEVEDEMKKATSVIQELIAEIEKEDS